MELKGGTIQLGQRSISEKKAYFAGFKAGVVHAIKRLETANEETSRLCLIEELKTFAEISGEFAE